MSKHDPEVTLTQILQYAQETVNICQGKTRHDLDQDRLLNLAITRLLEMLGEAANRVPEEIRIEYSDLPWLQMIAARNRLIHGYDSIDFDILWAIIQNDLPLLITRLKEILQII
jgi:uncharacterized protein with HEPN domain